MKIKIENDKSNGAGYAVLRASGSRLSDNIISIQIVRRDERPYLGARGWQTSETSLTPESITRVNDEIEVRIGPAVTSNMQQGIFEFSLFDDSDAKETARASWSNIIPPRIKTQSGGPVHLKELPKIGAGGGVETTGDLTNSVDRSTTSASSDLNPFIEEDIRQENAAEADNMDKKARRGLVVTLASLAILALLCVAGYFSYTARSNNQTDDGEEVGEGLAPVETNAGEALTPMEQARQFLAGNPDSDQMVVFSEDFFGRGYGDAGYVVLSRAAKTNSPAALLAMGGLYDPALTDVPIMEGMPERKADMAYNFYRQAKNAGNSKAAERISNLKIWAETAAADGDHGASVLLRLMAIEN